MAGTDTSVAMASSGDGDGGEGSGRGGQQQQQPLLAWEVVKAVRQNRIGGACNNTRERQLT